MLRKSILYFVLLIAMFSASNCGPTATPEPTLVPTPEPTLVPTLEPTLVPTLEPTLVPTLVPTLEPTFEPTIIPAIDVSATSVPLPLYVKLRLYKKGDGCKNYPLEAKGEIDYQSWMPTGFNGMLKLSGLEQNQSYVFTINGVKEDPRGNGLLKEGCNTPEGKLEGYCDFSFTADENGEITEPITQILPPGQYRIKFFVKKDDPSYCVFLYNDNSTLEFEIK